MTPDLFAIEATDDETRFVWHPSPLLRVPGGALEGGAGFGAALLAMERATGRPAIWATGQFLSFARGPESLDLDVVIEVTGHNTTQARCTVSQGGDEVLTAHAALGQRDFAHNGVWCDPPVVPPPSECPEFRYFKRGHGDFGDLLQLRLAHGRQVQEIGGEAPRGSGDTSLWVRCWDDDDHVVTAQDVAVLADVMPVSFADAIGRAYSGNSLDNTIRMGEPATTGWVLLSNHVDHVTNGFGHGRAELWAEDGTLLATASQTAVLRPYRSMR